MLSGPMFVHAFSEQARAEASIEILGCPVALQFRGCLRQIGETRSDPAAAQRRLERRTKPQSFCPFANAPLGTATPTGSSIVLDSQRGHGSSTLIVIERER